MSTTFKKHYYTDVPGLGNVAVTRHAQQRCGSDNIAEEKFQDVLYNGTEDIPEGNDILWRQKDGIRLVLILRPVPFKGASLVKTAFRIQAQAKAKK